MAEPDSRTSVPENVKEKGQDMVSAQQSLAYSVSPQDKGPTRQITRRQAAISFINATYGVTNMFDDIRNSGKHVNNRAVWPAEKLDTVLARIHKIVEETHEVFKLCNSTHYYEFKLEGEVPEVPKDF